MAEKLVKCIYLNNCKTRKEMHGKCKQCANNRMRNYIEDHFKQANDNPIPEQNPIVTYNGPAEQTMGYKCPVCGGYTNPYVMEKKLCGCCGFELNIRR